MDGYLAGRCMDQTSKTARQYIADLRQWIAKYPTLPCTNAAMRICIPELQSDDKPSAKIMLEKVLQIKGPGIDP